MEGYLADMQKFGSMGLGAAVRGLQSLPGAAEAQTRTEEAALRGAKGFETWVSSGGLNRLMGENCYMKGVISCVVGGGGGIMLGAFLAPFDTLGGLKVGNVVHPALSATGFPLAVPSHCALAPILPSFTHFEGTHLTIFNQSRLQKTQLQRRLQWQL